MPNNKAKYFILLTLFDFCFSISPLVKSLQRSNYQYKSILSKNHLLLHDSFYLTNKVKKNNIPVAGKQVYLQWKQLGENEIHKDVAYTNRTDKNGEIVWKLEAELAGKHQLIVNYIDNKNGFIHYMEIFDINVTYINKIYMIFALLWMLIIVYVFFGFNKKNKGLILLFHPLEEFYRLKKTKSYFLSVSDILILSLLVVTIISNFYLSFKNIILVHIVIFIIALLFSSVLNLKEFHHNFYWFAFQTLFLLVIATLKNEIIDFNLSELQVYDEIKEIKYIMALSVLLLFFLAQNPLLLFVFFKIPLIAEYHFFILLLLSLRLIILMWQHFFVGSLIFSLKEKE